MMKQSLLFLSGALSLLTSCASCEKTTVAPASRDTVIQNPSTPIGNNIKIKTGSSTYTATLHDNTTAAAFKALLPLTVTMTELNGNEKYVDLPRSLPTGASNSGTIQAGDLMLYGSSTVVLFYETFATSYSYTRIGRIDDTTGLAAAVGKGNVRVTFELQ